MLRKFLMVAFCLAAPWAAVPAGAVTTSDNASTAPASKAAAPAPVAKPASGAASKDVKDRDKAGAAAKPKQ